MRFPDMNPAAGERALCCLAFAMALWAGPNLVGAEPVHVAGTRVSLEPPPGFVSATEFQGFMLADRGATIVVSETPQPVENYRENFTRAALEERGMSFAESGKLTVDSYDARLIRVGDSTGEIEYEAWILVFGDIHRSIMIVASYPARGGFDLRTSTREALLSAKWEPRREIPDFEGLHFEIDESERLKISGRYPRTLILTEDGQGRRTIESPFLVVSSAVGRFDFGNLEAFSMEQLKQSEVIGDLTAVRGALKSVGGMPGYEITADASEPESGTAYKVYQLVLGEEGRVFIIQGFVGRSAARTWIPEFRAVAESLRRLRQPLSFRRSPAPQGRGVRNAVSLR